MNKIINQLKEEWTQTPLRNKLLAVMAGIDVTVNIFTPIILGALWVGVSGLDSWTSYFIFGIAILSGAFRAIKIGWMK